MGSLTSAVLARVRKLIPEAEAVDWLDADLLEYLNLEYADWAAPLGMIPGPGWFTMEQTFTLLANATTYSLATIIDSATVGSFAAVKTLWYVPSAGDESIIDSCSPGQESLWRLPVGQSAVGQQAPARRWMSRPAGVPTLNIHPQANVDRLFRAYIRYLPPALTNLAGERLQTEPRHDDVLVMGTALRSFLNVGETDPVIKQEYEVRKIRYLDEERNAAGEHESETTKVVVSEEMFGA